MSINPNAPCRCGNGKKYKNCCMNKKAVQESAMFEFSNPTRPASFTIGPNRELMAFAEDGTPLNFREASYIRSYQRDSKGEKTLTKIPMLVPTLPRHELEYLLSFHGLYAIDTNTDRETKISAATAIKFSLTIVNQIKKGTTISGQVLVESEIVDQRYWKDLDVNPEKVAIQNLIMGIHYLPGSRIGIINDCDLGNMSKINSSEIPLLEDFYLPSAFTLIYASSDAGKDSIANQILADCDKHSREILREIKANITNYFPDK